MINNIWYQPKAPGRDFEFTRPRNSDGSLTKSAMMLVTVRSFSGMFTRKQLLRMIGVSNYNARGCFCNMWNSARKSNLIKCGKNGVVLAGDNLDIWYDSYFC